MRAGQFRLPEEKPRRRWPILVAGLVACVGAAIAVILGSGVDFGSGARLTSAREGRAVRRSRPNSTVKSPRT